MKQGPNIALLRDFPDWQSPILVKELRQGLRTRFFTGALIIFHLGMAMLVISVAGGMVDHEESGGNMWLAVGALLQWALPLRAFSALSQEMRDGTADMLYLTNMAAMRIVFGKWLAYFSQTLLVAVSLLPYLLLRYQFGGVELWREAGALIILLGGSALATAATLAFSTQSNVALRLVLGGLTVTGGLVFLFFALILGEGENWMIPWSIFTRSSSPMILAMIGGGVFVAHAVYQMLALGASRIASQAEDHSSRKRLVALLSLGILAALYVALIFTAPPHSDFSTMLLLVVMAATLITCGDVVTEEMPRSAIPLVKFNRGRKWRRRAGRLLYPGWASGGAFSLLLWLCPAAALAVHAWRSGFDETDATFMLCSLSACMAPVILTAKSERPFMVWCVVQFSQVVLWLILMISERAAGSDDVMVISVLTPLMGALSMATGQDHLVVACAASAIAWTGVALWFVFRGMKIYTRLEAEQA